MKNQKLKIVFSLLLIPAVFLAQEMGEHWAIVTEMPTPVAAGQAVVLGSTIYILGGEADSLGTPINKVQVFDPRSQTWQTGGEMQAARSRFIADVYNGEIIICGGIRGDSLTDKSLENLEVIPEGVYNSRFGDYQEQFNRLNSAGLVLKNVLYLFGGFSDPIWAPVSLPYITEYDLASHTIAYANEELFLENMPYQQAAADYNDDIFIFGGVHNIISKQVYRYNTPSRIFEKMEYSLNIARAASAAVTFWDGKIYIIGGYNEKTAALDSVEVLFPDSGFFIFSAPLNIARKECMAVLFEDEIYVFGGRGLDGNYVKEVENLTIEAATAIVDDKSQPMHFILDNNYPNPFNNNTTIAFELPHSAAVDIDIYSSNGKHVKTLAGGLYLAGHHKIEWDGTNAANEQVGTGMYFYRMRSEFGTLTKKMLYLR